MQTLSICGDAICNELNKFYTGIKLYKWTFITFDIQFKWAPTESNALSFFLSIQIKGNHDFFPQLASKQSLLHDPEAV